jgi:hypothetical protein
MKRAVSTLLLFILISADSVSQPTLDTINACLKLKPRLFAKVDTRNSFIENSRAQIIGIKGGIHYGKRLYFGVGYNQLYNSAPAFNKEVYYTGAGNKTDSVTAKLQMWYISIHGEYVFHQAGRWKLSMPLQFGIGKTDYKYFLFGIKRRREENINLIYEPAVSVEYKLTRWFGLGADIGYRFMMSGDRKLLSHFTSPTYSFHLQLYYSELLKSMFPKKEWTKKL